MEPLRQELPDFAVVDQLIEELSAAKKATLPAGDKLSLQQLLPQVYDDLRSVARTYLGRERNGHTLQPTALVHEAYLRLLEQRIATWENRAHLLAIAARTMRRILMTHAEARGAARRGGGAPSLSLDLALDVFDQRDVSTTAVNSALRDLEALDPRQGQIVELRFFGGLSVEETAAVLGISPATVKREWAVAKLWLARALADAK